MSSRTDYYPKLERIEGDRADTFQGVGQSAFSVATALLRYAAARAATLDRAEIESGARRVNRVTAALEEANQRGFNLLATYGNASIEVDIAALSSDDPEVASRTPMGETSLLATKDGVEYAIIWRQDSDGGYDAPISESRTPDSPPLDVEGVRELYFDFNMRPGADYQLNGARL